MRNVGRAALRTLGGLIGTVVILLAGFSIVNSLTPIKLPVGPHVYVDAWDRGFVSATGTWTMENDRPAFPVQTSNIRCYRDDKSCTAAQAEIAFGDTLHLETYNYDITKWDNTTILFRTDAACVEYIYTIDRANK